MLEEYLTLGGTGQDMVVINAPSLSERQPRLLMKGRLWPLSRKIKDEHKQATHNVYAYQIGENNQLQRFSDDGEPSGTAGMPVLEVIKQMDLRNVVVVVTRYFGGTLLGAGGLVGHILKGRRSASWLQGIVKMVLHTRFEISVDYTFSGKLQNVVMQSPWRLDDIEYGAQVCFKVLAPPGEDLRVRETFTELTGGQAVIKELGKEYLAIPVEVG
jgi:uncharacterized YigZ family protein